MTTQLPDKLATPPIVEAVLELRFRSSLASAGDLLPGLLFSTLRPDFQTPETLPLGAIPKEFRDTRPELMYASRVKLAGGNRSLLIGDKVVTISHVPPYEGWSSFSALGQRVFESLRETGLVSGVERLSIKAVNLIELKGRSPFDVINGDFRLGQYKIADDGLHIRTQVYDANLLNIIEIAAQAQSLQPSRSGMMLSVDTIRLFDDNSFWTDIPGHLATVHAALKSIFFSLVKADVVNEWGPSWPSKTA